MGIFDKFKKKKDIINNKSLGEIVKKESKVMKIANYMLSDVRKVELKDNVKSLAINKLFDISSISISTAEKLKSIAEQNPKSSDKLYRITNLGKNDSLKAMKDGETFWGAIKRGDGKSTMAKLKEYTPNDQIAIDSTLIMMSAVLIEIESELVEIKELSKKIYTFLEHEKESEIEADMEILNKSINEYRYNLGDEKYMINNHKQVMDIKRTASKNILFYKKKIKDNLSKNRLFTTNGSMNSMIEEIKKEFKYYRLSVYTYAFSTLMEIMLIGNFKSEYLASKKNELYELNNEYTDIVNKALEYAKKNANKSIESNVLSGIGNAGKAIGNLAEKVKVKKVDTWLNEKGDNLKQTGQSIKDDFITKFDDIKDTNTDLFVEQIEKIDTIYNKTSEIYFDKENIYFV